MGNQLLPEDILVQVARYSDSAGKAAMEKTSRSCASSVSKAREHAMEMIYRKYKDLIDNTDLTTEQIYKSFTWNPPIGNLRVEIFQLRNPRYPHGVLRAGDVVNGGVHESYLAVKVIAERFDRPIAVCFIFRNGQLHNTLFLGTFGVGDWLGVPKRAAKDYLPYTQIQDLFRKQWVCFQNFTNGPVIRWDASRVEKVLRIIRRDLRTIAQKCSLDMIAIIPDMIAIIALLMFFWWVVKYHP